LISYRDIILVRQAGRTLHIVDILYTARSRLKCN